MELHTTWIYLSPHFDDVAISCGGLAWEQAQRGDRVEVWTICAGEIPPGAISPFAESLHKRWQTSQNTPAQRRDEDLASCAAMGASAVHFHIPDSIYRCGGTDNIPLYDSENAIFGSLHPYDSHTVEKIRGELKHRLPEDAELVSPMTIGGHVDHRLVRAGAEQLGRRLWYYADAPYVMKHPGELDKLIQDNWICQFFPISDAGLAAWQGAVAAHASQISTYWPNLEAMRSVISNYCIENEGVRLWRAPA